MTQAKDEELKRQFWLGACFGFGVTTGTWALVQFVKLILLILARLING